MVDIYTNKGFITEFYGTQEIAADFALLKEHIGNEKCHMALARLQQCMGVDTADDKRASCRSITLEIKKVPVPSKCARGTKMKYGVELTVGGRTTSIYLRSTHATMIFVCTLLRHKAGQRLYRGEMLKGVEAPAAAWFKGVYNFMFPYAGMRFEKWFAQLQKGDGHNLSQGKCNCNAMLKAELPQHVAELCELVKVNGKCGAYYKVGIDAQNIIVPEELLRVVGQHNLTCAA